MCGGVVVRRCRCGEVSVCGEVGVERWVWVWWVWGGGCECGEVGVSVVRWVW